MKRLVEVKIDSLRVSLTNQQRIVVLKQTDQDRYLPVWIGPYEAEAITIALQEIEVSRPLTHDLIKKIIDDLDSKLNHVEISALKDDVFYGTLVISKEGKKLRIDCRPSDAIAIAVRAHVPIMASETVMAEASIIPDEISDSSENEAELTSADLEVGGKTSEGEDRLSIFENYLKDKSGLDTPPNDSDSNNKNNDADENDKDASPE